MRYYQTLKKIPWPLKQEKLLTKTFKNFIKIAKVSIILRVFVLPKHITQKWSKQVILSCKRASSTLKTST